MEPKLDFSYDGKVAGRFTSVPAFPKHAGSYRYMPYRGPGHLLLQRECASRGNARCSYSVSGRKVEFVARVGSQQGIIEIDEIVEANQ